MEHFTPDCSCLGKQCSKCNTTLCIEGFHRWKQAPDGRRATCKACRKAEYQTDEFRAKRRAYHQEHAEQINVRKRAWYHTHPEQARLQSKNSRLRHPEQVKAYQHAYNRSEQGKARERQYRQNNPEKVKATQRKSWHKYHAIRIPAARAYHAFARTQRTGAGGAFTVAEWEALKARYNYTCLCCGKREPEINLTIDHVYPVTKHGSSSIDNIQPLCLSCNSRKGTKVIDYRIKENYS